MIGRDLNSSPSQYRVWVDILPDLTGESYSGIKSGELPLDNISTYFLPDGYSGNFNLPNPFYWKTTKHLLPNLAYRSQSAIIDGYIYLFGGQDSNKILRAHVSNPCDFINTGATLPVALGGSQLAIVDGYIYLFGGHTTTATNVILRASTSDPLAWSSLGTLPLALCDSQLVTLNDKLYLLGGFDTDARNVILVADRNTPGIWTQSSSFLPAPIAGASVTIFDGYIYLMGGYHNGAKKTIFKASVGSPETWSLIEATLPEPMYYSHYFKVGDQHLLFGTTQPNPTETERTSIFYTKFLSDGYWNDWIYTVPGYVHQSELICVYDRLFLLGVNGNTAIFTSDYFAKVEVDLPACMQYTYDTRSLFDDYPDKFDLFAVLGYHYWKTDFS